jgi:hypothetical protein
MLFVPEICTEFTNVLCGQNVEFVLMLNVELHKVRAELYRFNINSAALLWHLRILYLRTLDQILLK